MTPRILLITESLGAGGAERQICGLSAMLTNNGYTCRLITYCENQFYEPYIHEHGVDYEFVPSLCDKSTRVYRLVKYLRRYKPTTVISYLPSVNQTCCLARLFYQCQLIVSERNNNTSVTKGDHIRFNLYRLSDVIVPNSYCQGEFIKNIFPFLAKKVHPIINFVDVEKFVPAEKSEVPDKFRFVIAARYSKQKNCIKFLDAVKLMKDDKLPVHFDWYGSKSFDADYTKVVENYKQKLNIDDYITLHDASSNIVEEYQKADAFILPSLFEGYPNVVAEAMSCELPILCSNVFENPYIVTEGENGFLFDPNDAHSIKDSVKKLLGLSVEIRQNMGRRNRQICLTRNSENSFFRKYLDIILY